MANKRMSIAEFLPLYMEAAENGLTKEEFAAQIGVKPDTVYQRAYELRKGGLEDEIPLLRTEGRVPKLEKAREILKARRSGTAKAPAKAKAKEASKPAAEATAGGEEDELAAIFGG